MDASIVVAATRFDLLRQLIASIEWHTPGLTYEIVIVTFREVPPDLARKCRVIREDAPQGCVKAFNLGFRAAVGDYIVNLNDDCLVEPLWLGQMLTAIQGQDVQGAFAFSSPYTQGYVVQAYAGLWYANFGCMRRELMARLGFWDERYRHYAADPDFSLTVWHAGLAVVPVYTARILHACVDDEWRREDLRDPAAEQLRDKWKGIYP